MKRYKLLAVIVAAAALIGAGVATQTNFTSLQVGAPGYSPDLTVGDGDIYAEDSIEADGTLRTDSDLDVNGTANISGNTTISGTLTASVTREVRLVAADFIANAGSPSNAIIGSANAQGWAMDADSDESISSMFKVPTDWDSSTDFTCNIYWSSTDTNGNDAVFDLITVPTAETEDAGLAGNTDSVTDTDDTTADALNVSGDITVAASSEFASGDLVYVTINRDADNGSDTLAADASVQALACSYTATR